MLYCIDLPKMFILFFLNRVYNKQYVGALQNIAPSSNPRLILLWSGMCFWACHEDFVAQNANFKEFAADVAMQVAANDEVAFMTVDDVPAEEQECLYPKSRVGLLVGLPHSFPNVMVAAQFHHICCCICILYLNFVWDLVDADLI